MQLTSFVGREREMQEVKRLLGTSRLLSLTGVGGCGKSRLALQVAGDLIEDYPEGVWLAELAALADPALVPQTVASALGIREEPGCPIMQTLPNCLRPKELLLLLDNCEHLLAACAQLAEALLRACPHLRILATSREALRVPGERRFRVPPLSLPSPVESVNSQLSTLLASEAVCLFVDRAAMAAPTFALTHDTAPAVAQICQRLDGIPLAIELAAARVSALPVPQIVGRPDDRFRLLTGGGRTALPHQQTLRALIDWSYDLLSLPEQTLLRRLSVFSGGGTMEAAEAVCADEVRGAQCAVCSGDLAERPAIGPPSDRAPRTAHCALDEVLDLLTQLVDKSLVIYEEPGTRGPTAGGGRARYRLLETVRGHRREAVVMRGTGCWRQQRQNDGVGGIGTGSWSWRSRQSRG